MAPLRKHDMKFRPAMTEEIAEIWNERWFGMVVGIDTVYYPKDVSGLALVDHHDEIVGLVTYHVDGPSGQIVTLDTVVRGRGFGRRLLEAIENKFHDLGLGRGSMSILMSAYHERRTSRCYNSFFSAGLQEAWDLAKGLPDPEVARSLAELGFTTVVIHHPPIKKDMLALVRQIDALAEGPDPPLELIHRNPVMSAGRDMEPLSRESRRHAGRRSR